MKIFVGAYVVSGLLTYYFVPLMIQVASRLGIMDQPNGGLKNHARPTPYLGGVAIYVGFICAMALIMPPTNQFFLLLLGITLLLFVGLIDDLVALTPLQKIVGQCIAVICFLKGGFYLKSQFLLLYDSFLVHLFVAFFSAFWFLTVINSINLIDIMDGLATTVALACCALFSFFAWFLHAPEALLILGCFMGALTAFLWFNKPPARIYLGDAGSLMIGGFLAVIPCMISWGLYTPYAIFAPPLILAVPLLELTTLILIRTYKGIPFYQGSPHHFAHFLRKAHWSVIAILFYAFLVTLFFGVVAFGLVSTILSFPFTITIGIFSVALWWIMLSSLCKHTRVAFMQK